METKADGKNNCRFRADVLLIAFCLLLAAVFYLWFALGSEEGTSVEVCINGELVAKYSLAVEGTYILNGGTNTLVIKDGCAHMEEANCPDHICVKQGEISRSGQCITCLPNKITVTVRGGTPEFDAVVG